MSMSKSITLSMVVGVAAIVAPILH
ncbi:MAG: hypothetical protein RL261_2077, partial [Pseudomonadota bacterium]